MYAQGAVVPAITDGCAAIASGMALSVCAAPVPHPFEGVTEILPAEADGITVILLVPCPETTVHPVGNVQLYVIPFTLVTV